MILLSMPYQRMALISTPIFYTNALPHLGHAYSMVLTAAVARSYALQYPSHPILLTTGTDEHGWKVQKSAFKVGCETKAFCDQKSGIFRNLSEGYKFRADRFIRTTDICHKKLVQEYWKKIQGEIKLEMYKGWYCEQEECFVGQRQVEEKRRDEGQQIVYLQEQNYVFDLDPYKQLISQWINEGVKPKVCHKQIFNTLQDYSKVSLTRPASRLTWGIPTPADPQHIIYVWLDALLNYHTAISTHPQRSHLLHNMIHVIGKDIIKFHGILWPGLLLAGKLPLPHTVLVHGHWTYGGRKMSKSVGNVVCPFQTLKRFGLTALQLFFLTEGPRQCDRDFDPQFVKEVYNDFIMSYSNLLLRVSGKLAKSGPRFTRQLNQSECHLQSEVDLLLNNGKQELYRYQFKQCYIQIKRVLALLNKHVSEQAPWKRPDHEQAHLCHLILTCLRKTNRILTVILPEYIATVDEAIAETKPSQSAIQKCKLSMLK